MKLKGKDKVIVAVSGGFDPLHVGHVRLFQEARAFGDELVVILNNDNWLHKKKGFVFIPQAERKELLEALCMVDSVVITSHPRDPSDMSVCKGLLDIRPNIFVNGGDRTRKNIPEVSVCQQINCEMIFNVGKGGKVQSSSWLLRKHVNENKLRKQAHKFSTKRVVVFDLDGTLTKSKTVLDKEMATLLCQLLTERVVAVVSGGSYTQFENQFLNLLGCTKTQLENLFVLPISGGSLYRYRSSKWQRVYQHTLTAQEKTKILAAFRKSFRDINYVSPKKTYGEIIEDRKGQITFSALGQNAPLNRKKEWNAKADIRPKLKTALETYLPDYEIRLGGKTSVDVTKKGIDKAYGIRQLTRQLSLPEKELVFIGDALYEGGNDYAVKRTGVAIIEVKDHEETKTFIRYLLSFLK